MPGVPPWPLLAEPASRVHLRSPSSPPGDLPASRALFPWRRLSLSLETGFSLDPTCPWSHCPSLSFQSQPRPESRSVLTVPLHLLSRSYHVITWGGARTGGAFLISLSLPLPLMRFPGPLLGSAILFIHLVRLLASDFPSSGPSPPPACCPVSP